MPKVIPTLSIEKWVAEPSRILDRVFSYFLVSNKTQSTVYNIKSLPDLLHKNGRNILNLTDDITNNLYDLLNPFFDQVTVEVRDITLKDSSKGSLTIYIECIKDTKRYNLSKVLTAENYVVTRVVETLNSDNPSLI